MCVCVCIIERAARLTGRYIHMHTINMKSKYLLCIFRFSLPFYSEISFVDRLSSFFNLAACILISESLVPCRLISPCLIHLYSNDSNKHDHCCLCLAPSLLHLHSSSNSCLLRRNRFVFAFKTRRTSTKKGIEKMSDSCKIDAVCGGDRIV